MARSYGKPDVSNGMQARLSTYYRFWRLDDFCLDAIQTLTVHCGKIAVYCSSPAPQVCVTTYPTTYKEYLFHVER